MIRTAFKVVSKDNLGNEYLPVIRKVDITDLEGQSWRDAKKALRQWYLDKAASVRDLREPKEF